MALARTGVTLATVAAVLLGAGPTLSGARATSRDVGAQPDRIEAFADYEAQSLCTPSAKRGTERLARLLARKFGGGSISIPRGCAVGGTSEHKEGRALDWMVSVRAPAQRRRAEAFLEWLLAPDAAGNPAARARRLGVMYIGWDNRIWRSYDQGSWGELHGCLSQPKRRAPAYDSTCHRNHVHVSLSWDGATARTSYWTGRVLPGPCAASWDTDPSVTTPASGDTVVLDTARGIGTPDTLPCRLGAPRWEGDGRTLSIALLDPDAPPEADAPAGDPDDPWADEPWADDDGTWADAPADPGAADPGDPADGPDPATDPASDDPATHPASAPGYDVRLRVERLRGNAPITRLALGEAPDGAPVRVEAATRLPREVTVRVGSDRALTVSLSRGLAAVRLTALSVTPVPSP